jgi:signal transduction histidine kinase/DNA-binding NarL/FixJ family response regulator/HPt (histidine-containing phosphotransfer) domain-containing protein
MAVVVFITVGTSLFFMRSNIEQTIMDDITIMRDITNEFISSEISLLKSKTLAAANRLKATPMDSWGAVLQDEVESSDVFKAIHVFERNGLLLAGYGYPKTPTDLLFTDFSRKAFNGETIITSTRLDPSGELVFHVFAPLAQLLLSATISGTYFSQLLEGHRVWETGSLFIIDGEGTVIANKRSYFVLNRYNFLADPSQSKEVLSTQAFTRRMLRNTEGVGRYKLEGLEQICVYTKIKASNSGWVLGVSAPIKENPAAYLDRGLLYMTCIFLTFGGLMAFFASGFVDKQFNTINTQYTNLTELSEIAQSASDAKTHFLANMSHEMRTPLNAIIGFSELILHGHSDPDELEDELKNIHTAGLTLLGIVNDILDISKIESGKFELINVDYDLASLINDTVTVNLIRIAEKPIEFGLEIDKKLPSRMLGDELRLKQIFNNLLSNAFKYTMEGSVDLAVTGHQDGENVWLVITVKDTGIGIREDDLAKLFSEYSQVDTKSNRKIEGTGLGLSITRRLVELMDGTIDVKSTYGQGTTFKVTVRQQFVTSVPIGEKVVENLENLDGSYKDQVHGGLNITKMPYAKVLVVDDVQANLDVARGMLKPYGMQIDCATSGQRAIDLVKEAKVKYHAIFMDHMMPGMDGIETVANIRALDSEYAKTVPIIALTANAIVGNEQMFLAHGFQAFVSKPIELRRMDMVLKQWVRNRDLENNLLADLESQASEMEKLVASENIGPKPPKNGKAKEDSKPDKPIDKGPAPAPLASAPLSLVSPKPGPQANSSPTSDQNLFCEGIDLMEGVRRFSGDQQVYFEVLKSYRDSMAELVNQLKEPTAENLKNYTIVIHGLKSSSYGVCAKELGRLAETLEHKADDGDLDYVLANNSRFLTSVEQMLSSLNQMFKKVGVVDKPMRDTPDPALLARLKEAISTYDMDGVDMVISELDGFSYSSDPDLTAWLKDRAEEMDFQTILERLPIA